MRRRPIIVGDDRKRKRSKHGVGHLLPPLPGSHDYITEWWTHLLRVELDYAATAAAPTPTKSGHSTSP